MLTITINLRKIAYYTIQKLIGVLFIAGSLWTVPINDGDATICLITIPLGLFAILTRKRIMDLSFIGLYDSEDPDQPKRRRRRR